ncbi:hypothetical protein P9265_22405 [Schinkia azotoformans]|uniref:hypothetical protein n=1 Tax=Schinkia azotoformans TaxID=1454 RepID=UPI002E1D3D1B|nr:hypothetical protein [Schinkia azotoformans]
MKKIKFSILVTMVFALFTSVIPASATTYNTTKPQTITAYSLSEYVNKQLRKTASGKIPQVGFAAVKPKVKGTCCTNPVFPFGTQIVLRDPVSHWYYGELDTFKVEDMGQINWQDSELTTHWLDLWWGYSDDSRNLNDARAFEIQYRNYTAYY